MEQLLIKIKDKTAKVGVIGLGYVGLPLAVAFAEKYCVVGYDVNKKTIDLLSNAISPIRDIKSENLKKYINKTFIPTNDFTHLEQNDFLIICVPTPLTHEKEPNLSYVKNACATISNILRAGQFVILESTTYPGTTEEVVVPILEKTGLISGVDFGLAYSPERIDPGNKNYTIENTPKVVGGINENCTNIAAELYKSIINEDVIKVTDCKTAEATKIFENIFRDVNIALVNELALIFEKMKINTWEVIDAASTKPFGFMPFYPGPGVGGHCIPLDPYYLSYKAKKVGIIPRFIEMSGEINDFMKIHTVNLIAKSLSQCDMKIFDSRIAIVGLAYKKDISDTRESPAKKIIEELINIGAHVKVYDPYAKSIDTNHGKFESENTFDDAVRNADCVVFLTNHSKFKYIDLKNMKEIMKNPIIVDCKNIFNGYILKDFKYCCIGIGQNILE